MRVVHVIQSPAFAGVERHVARLAAAQADRGDRVLVIGGDPVQMRAQGHPLVEHRRGSSAGEAFAALRSSLRTRPDVVHAHMTVAEAASVVALLGTTIPIVVTRHFGRPRGRNAVVRFATSTISRRIAAQIAISEYVAAHVEGRSVVVHPGVPIQEDALAVAQRSRTVAVVQRLEAEKATDDALRIFAQSGLAELGWRLDVAGSGSQRPMLEALADRLGIRERTRFLGHRSDVAELMRHSGVLIAPCPVEGLGLTVVEAMAAGLPVVAAAAGGHLETLRGVSGVVLYDPASAGVGGAAASLRELALDEVVRDTTGRALQRVQRDRFTLARQAEATAAVYEAVL